LKIYTRRGDGGETSLLGGSRVDKGHTRVEAMGDVDELNAALGCAIAVAGDALVKRRLESIQHDLFALGAELASPRGASEGRRRDTPGLRPERTLELEGWIDETEDRLAPLTAFVLPGGVPSAAVLHLARTVCRRAERSVVRLSEEASVDPDVLRYLNRLSDLLFVLARNENRLAGAADVEWAKGS
jgi:cob(I)alamin adenosyltransferase